MSAGVSARLAPSTPCFSSRAGSSSSDAPLGRWRSVAGRLEGDHRNRRVGRRCDAGGLGHGWTKEPKPRSSRIDSISQKAMLGVKTSAAPSTPVYFAITGAAPAPAAASK
jgi:hypothetical protein